MGGAWSKFKWQGSLLKFIMRKLPVYLLLDCSESMIGDAIQSVRVGVDRLLRELRSNPHTLETAHVSIITFDSEARQLVPLSEVSEVLPPELLLAPGTAMGAGIRLLCKKIGEEVTKTSASQKGDYRPLVFLLTDGQPTDLADTMAALQTLTQPRIANIYAIGCGTERDVDFRVLGKITDIVLKMEKLTPEAFGKLFVWLSSSIQSSSIEASDPDAANKINLDKLPPEITRIDPRGLPESDESTPLQVFVKGCCSRAASPQSSALPSFYLMRYRFNDVHQLYEPTQSHKLEGEMRGTAAKLSVPSIPSDLMMGPGCCPYCEAQGAGACQCGTIFCLPYPAPSSVTCPVCKNTCQLSSGGSFDITGSAG